MHDQDHDTSPDATTDGPDKQSHVTSARTPQRTEGKAMASASPPENAAIPNAAIGVNLREVAAAGFMHWIMNASMSTRLGAEEFALFRDKLLVDAGAPTDPIEVMLVEQIALTHFAIGRLHIKACSMDNAKLSVAFTDAATRLLGEFRRCSLALEEYRSRRIARKERSVSNDGAEKKGPAARNGKAQPSVNGSGSANGNGASNGKRLSNGNGQANGKKTPANTKLTTNAEIPECTQQRMGFAANDVAKQTVEIGGNGKG